ncbi:hypothetical protein [Streptomyces chartreusis]|uniref:Tetratricopeptide repeat protein n=1 Tax=Streptomyces chartreusis TaxID=1969 RepID=A0A7H8T7F4_STRCX|nr:hypothetical protein [Streptomyces chartreusis]QKZ17840.1 hypothetical protein HUT05_11075 [Streptomyces chartreusis]
MTLHRLASYHDLDSDRGPLHARAVADIGRHYLAGLQLPPYQSFPAVSFRAAMAEEVEEQTVAVRDPREHPTARRSAAWRQLCADLGTWQQLDSMQQLDVATVLARLGFWTALADLPLPEGKSGHVALRLAERLCVARRLVIGDDPEVTGRLRRLLRARAEADDVPLQLQLGAAVGLVVEHARSDVSPTAMAHWQSKAQALMARAPYGTYGDILLSACWRGVSFVPFHQGDHDRVREMLDASERLARSALRTVGPRRRLLAEENFRLVLMTRARAAQARGDRSETEGRLRSIVHVDPQDPVSHVRLADFLVLVGQPHKAGDHYRRAAELGAPCTAYAREQAANCRALRLTDASVTP